MTGWWRLRDAGLMLPSWFKCWPKATKFKMIHNFITLLNFHIKRILTFQVLWIILYCQNCLIQGLEGQNESFFPVSVYVKVYTLNFNLNYQNHSIIFEQKGWNSMVQNANKKWRSKNRDLSLSVSLLFFVDLPMAF